MSLSDNNMYSQVYDFKNLPSIDDLSLILNETDSLNLNAELEEYKDTYKFSVAYLIPSIGYDMVNARPMVVFNSSGLMSHWKNKRVVKRKEISLSKKGDLQHQNNNIKLVITYNDLKSGIVQLDMILETFGKYKKLYEIHSTQYLNNEINTEEFLQKEIAFTERRKVVIGAVDYINEKFTALELLLNTQLFKYLTYETVLTDESTGD